MLLLFAVLLFTGLSATDASAHAYRNCGTTESTHNSDSLVYFCEDFEEVGVYQVNGKGRWYAGDCDTTKVLTGGIANQTKGWCGTIFANPITPDGAETCAIAVPAGSCAGNHYTSGGAIGARNIADHSLYVGEPGTVTAQNHVFVRYYEKWASGYLFGAEKVLTFNRGAAGVGGIWWGNLHMNCGGNSDGTSLTGKLQWQPAHSSLSGCQNIATGEPNTGAGADRINGGIWYAIQIELDLGSGSSDGTLKFYVDNCGANGDQCTGSPTLRTTLSGISFTSAGTDNLMSLWFENWANPASNGESYIDQIVVRDGASGLIPFVSGGGGGGSSPRFSPSFLRRVSQEVEP